MKIATAVVTFHPTEEVLQKIEAYTKFLDFVIVADNTGGEGLDERFSGLRKLAYINLGGNQGIGRALNAAADRAFELGYGWLLMLDQDSVLTDTVYSALEKQVTIVGNSNLGIISANQVSRASEIVRNPAQPDISQVDRLMTSGSILNLNAFLECGRFEESLFIDHVDHEYCLRLQRGGYGTVQCSNIVLDHAHGEVHQGTFLGRSVTYIDHKPFRFYYFVRNGLYVGAKYFWYRPQFLVWVLLQITRRLSKAFLFQDQKLLRAKMFYWGIKDFIIGRHGVGHSIHDNFPR